jgi:hypothetical protein
MFRHTAKLPANRQAALLVLCGFLAAPLAASAQDATVAKGDLDGNVIYSQNPPVFDLTQAPGDGVFVQSDGTVVQSPTTTVQQDLNTTVQSVLGGGCSAPSGYCLISPAPMGSPCLCGLDPGVVVR